MHRWPYFVMPILLYIVKPIEVIAQSYTRQDTLRGTITPERAWWDLTYYDLAIDFDIKNQSISGSNTIYFKVLNPQQVMQIDLQEPLNITSVDFKSQPLSFSREGNAYWIKFPAPLNAGEAHHINIQYKGKPVVAKRPPWDGGLTWSKDSKGHPFVSSSCQGLGSSVWWPCKDHMYDEPDSMLLRFTTPPSLMDVSNGRLRKIEYHPDGRKTFHWFVSNPINNYGINVNIGRYAHWSDTIQGEKGVLDLDFYVLEDNYTKAREHFKDVYRTIKAFEYWFGPYPFYEDGYKLVEVPYLGMEHQSSVTYGNEYKFGYKGRDLSSTGWGLKWDFIIVHETAHEWWANSITYKDMADMWIHESFANYAESLFLDYHYGRQAANEYVIGIRLNISNDKPIIGDYNVNQEGSSDMYYKGGNMLHTLRHWIDDDVKWRKILRGLQQEFYHQTVSTIQIENYISKYSGKDLKSFFDQYLRDTRIPVLEYRIKGRKLMYHYTHTVDGFAMPLKISIDGGESFWISPSAKWQEMKRDVNVKTLTVDPNFYVHTYEVKE